MITFNDQSVNISFPHPWHTSRTLLEPLTLLRDTVTKNDASEKYFNSVNQCASIRSSSRLRKRSEFMGILFVSRIIKHNFTRSTKVTHPRDDELGSLMKVRVHVKHNELSAKNDSEWISSENRGLKFRRLFPRLNGGYLTGRNFNYSAYTFPFFPFPRKEHLWSGILGEIASIAGIWARENLFHRR